jgi:hypothetical protein
MVWLAIRLHTGERMTPPEQKGRSGMTASPHTLATPQRSGTLVDLFRRRATIQPEQCAFTFLVDGEAQELSLTYAALDRHARAIAAQLQALTAAGERALLLYPPGLDFIEAFLGCVYQNMAEDHTYKGVGECHPYREFEGMQPSR